MNNLKIINCQDMGDKGSCTKMECVGLVAAFKKSTFQVLLYTASRLVLKRR